MGVVVLMNDTYQEEEREAQIEYDREITPRPPQVSGPIYEKTTLIRNAETLELVAEPFAKGYKVRVKYRLDPNNPIALDALILKVEESTTRMAVKMFIENIIEKDLGGKLLKDD